ncbi:uncharacterized protein TNCV_4271651 [Trichonephila clavipes]|nr:uncharacterized protein TNCV_4271651 [Trichonephila clavipes]
MLKDSGPNKLWIKRGGTCQSFRIETGGGKSARADPDPDHTLQSVEVTLDKADQKQLPQVAKVDLVWQLGCNLGQSLSNHGPHVFYRRKIWRASRLGNQFNLVIDEEHLDNACHVWSRIILLKYGCGQALKVRKDNCVQHLGDVALVV